MDEDKRKLERRVAAEGDPLARVRLAREKLRAHDARGALEALGPEDDATSPETRTLECPVRAEALADLDRFDDALRVLARAAGGGALEWRPLAAVIARLLEGRGVLGRPRAAAILARVRAGEPELETTKATLARDPDPLVRIALVTERPAFDAIRDRSTRVYGSHGPDYETGVFVAFEMPVEHRLRFFEPRLGAAVNAALAALADDASLVESASLRTAYGEGYGLGGAHDLTDGGAGLQAAIARLDALDLLPWSLRWCGVRPYDVMEDEARLARRLANDLRGHPARQKPTEECATLLERILSHYPLTKKQPAPRDLVTPLIEEARATLTPVGERALEVFAKLARSETLPF